MYSGTGTAIFDWIRFASAKFSFSVLIDSEYKVNLDATSEFCRNFGIPLYVSTPCHMPGCPDSGVSGIARHLQRFTYDVVECVSWANASTNLAVLSAMRPGTKLVFTPHSQPQWTLGSESRYFMVQQVFARMVRSSDAVFIDSVAEQALPAFAGADESTIHHVPLGVDTSRFAFAGSNQPNLLTCVCDCREPRKRVDLLLAAFGLAIRQNPNLRLTLAGRGSDSVAIQPELEPFVSRLGFVSSGELQDLYRRSGLLVLLSDYEAFGLPIAEALCCGSQVLLNRHDVMLELFESLPGVSWTTNTDAAMTAAKMLELGPGPFDSRQIGVAASARFGWGSTYGRKLAVLQRLLASSQTGAARGDDLYRTERAGR